jgi:hypothetical protein
MAWQTVHTWLRRYAEGGIGVLVEQSDANEPPQTKAAQRRHLHSVNTHAARRTRGTDRWPNIFARDLCRYRSGWGTQNAGYGSWWLSRCRAQRCLAYSGQRALGSLRGQPHADLDRVLAC